MSPPDPLEQRVGTTLAGKYRLERVLGAGGMGAVYAATNTWTERRVAIKVMLSGHVMTEDLVARFMREARAATKIAHDNIVQVLDMGQDADGSLYIVQEFLQGSDLRKLLDERRSLSVRESIEILAPVMSALIAAHKHGIVHRDLKPENIFLTKTAADATVPKLIDFGIAKMDAGADRGLTRTGAAMGTPHYMAPEQARGERTIDAQTDVWAVGVVLYEMLSGQCPYDADNYNALMLKISTEPPRRIEEVAGGIPDDLARVVHRAVERDRALRFRSMLHFLGGLLECNSLGDENWTRSVRSTFRDVVQSPAELDPHALSPTTPAFGGAAPSPVPGPSGRKPSTFNEGPGWIPSAAPGHTMGQTWREVSAPPSRSSRGVIVGGVAVLVVVGAVVGSFLARPRNMPGPTGVSPRPASEQRQFAAPVAAPAVPPATPSMFTVSVTVTPSAARLTLDGAAIPSSAFVRALPRDGTQHVLTASAEGYEPYEIAFADAPPPPSIVLLRRETPAERATRVSRVGPRAPVAPPQVANPPGPAEHTTTRPPSTRANGAPIIGE